MRVAVLGAGVVGVTTAYELAKDGHEVVVIDRLPEAAAETSFANAGLIAPGHAYTWSSPKAPGILLRSLFQDGQALRLNPSLDPRLWSWCLKFLRNCTAERAAVNTKRKVRLCRYSQQRLHTILDDTGIACDIVTGGLLYLYRTGEAFERGARNTRILAEEGLSLRAVGTDEAIGIDPSLAAAREKIAGAIHCPSDESGDCRTFTLKLAAHCAERLGVTFRYSTEILGVRRTGDRIEGLETARGPITADQYVLCLGVFSPDFARKLDVRLPVYPIKGYSVTFPIEPGMSPPTIGGVDEGNLVAYARFGDRLRITATAEFSGYDKSHRPQDFTHMLAAVKDLYPNGADYSRPSYWSGLRPMTPEGTPIFGRGRVRNVVFNTGHGHMGWTMSAGSARIVADLLASKSPVIDTQGMMLAA